MSDETAHEIVVTISAEHISGSYRGGDDEDAIVSAIEDALESALELRLNPTGRDQYPDDVEEPVIQISVASVRPARAEPTPAQVEAAARGWLTSLHGSGLTDQEWQMRRSEVEVRHMRSALLAMWQVSGKP